MSTNVPIASITLSAATPSVTFSGIPQTYTDLVVVVNGSIDATQTPSLAIRLNGDIGNSYSSTILEGNGTSTYSQRYSGNRTLMQFNYYTAFYSTNIANSILHIQNYSNSTTYKTVLGRFNITGGNAPGTAASVGLYRGSTSAVTSISISPDFGAINWASGSTFNLYGIANASITNVAKATGGDSVYTNGTYWYHIFRSSGTFTPTQALTADYLVVAGGGGGGPVIGGGGGAGGLRCTVTATGGGGSVESALSLTAQAYTVTIGAGGGSNTNGNDSVFSTITSTGGGKGGGNNNSPVGGSGGSGGGAGGGGTAGLVNYAGTANQGYQGGQGIRSAPDYGAGGGGGAGAVGNDGTATAGGNGGNGVATSISGSSVTYAGGGGGGTFSTGTSGSGGTGGGGAAGSGGASGTAGTVNTGGGGGGGDYSGSENSTGGNGGSGIVIVRYPV